jgi:hypothetical protein
MDLALACHAIESLNIPQEVAFYVKLQVFPAVPQNLWVKLTAGVDMEAASPRQVG